MTEHTNELPPRPALADSARLFGVRSFIRFAKSWQRLTSRRLPGIGFVTRRLKNPFLFQVHGRTLAFSPTAANAYSFLIAGMWNEEETHDLFKQVLGHIDADCTFVDVGASIGEMVIDAASYPRVKSVIAFEPQPDSARAIEMAAQANGYKHIQVVTAAVCASAGRIGFARAEDPSQSHVAASGDSHVLEVTAVTLDQSLANVENPCVVLMDVEGSELEVLRGATQFIARCKPLVIFEYNWRGRMKYSLADVQHTLGPDYRLYRLRNDGKLDTDFSNTWNCVAVPAAGELARVVAPLILPDAALSSI